MDLSSDFRLSDGLEPNRTAFGAATATDVQPFVTCVEPATAMAVVIG